MEVIKIRLQAQHHSLADPLDIPQYRNAAHAMYTVLKEEGFGAIYRGVTLTALRQGMSLFLSSDGGHMCFLATVIGGDMREKDSLLDRKEILKIPARKLDLSSLTNGTPSTITISKSNTLRSLGSNQAVNFTAYTEFKEILQRNQPQYADSPLPSYQTTLIGLVSGAMGPLSNAPIDTIKTRLQKTPGVPGETAMSRITAIAKDMFR
jgi:hypothetical protein